MASVSLQDLPDHYLAVRGFREALRGDADGRRALEAEASRGNVNAIMALVLVLRQSPQSARGTRQIATLVQKACGETRGTPRDCTPAQADACFEHAENCRLGCGVALDHGEAVRYYRAALNRRHPRAALWLGIMYELGLGVPADVAEAVRLYHRGALEFDDPEAKFRWARLLLRPSQSRHNDFEIIDKQTKLAVGMLEQLVYEQSHLLATYTLGMLLLGKIYDIPCPPDEKDNRVGKELLGMAADAQLAVAQHELASMLLTSSSAADQSRGIELLQLAAAQRFQPAIDALASAQRFQPTNDTLASEDVP